tara:strand:+ start:2612 stop:2719 length:108 start_codon:yes stop_codon:yes gene_type:complete
VDERKGFLGVEQLLIVDQKYKEKLKKDIPKDAFSS